jgi:hypothetical protein
MTHTPQREDTLNTNLHLVCFLESENDHSFVKHPVGFGCVHLRKQLSIEDRFLTLHTNCQSQETRPECAEMSVSAKTTIATSTQQESLQRTLMPHAPLPTEEVCTSDIDVQLSTACTRHHGHLHFEIAQRLCPSVTGTTATIARIRSLSFRLCCSGSVNSVLNLNHSNRERRRHE